LAILAGVLPAALAALAGLWPAWRAARLPPTDAIRYACESVNESVAGPGIRSRTLRRRLTGAGRAPGRRGCLQARAPTAPAPPPAGLATAAGRGPRHARRSP